MSFLGRMTESWFKANNRGQVAFYPWGKLGKGYILGGDEKEKQVRRFDKRHLLFALGLAFLTIITVGPGFGLLWLSLWTLFYWWRVNSLLQGCEISS